MEIMPLSHTHKDLSAVNVSKTRSVTGGMNFVQFTGLFYMYKSRQFSYYPFNLIYFNVSKYMWLANVESLKRYFIISSATSFLFMHNFVSQR